jgi:hypothetical protein
MCKFIALISSNNIIKLTNLAKYLSESIKIRNTFVSTNNWILIVWYKFILRIQLICCIKYVYTPLSKFISDSNIFLHVIQCCSFSSFTWNWILIYQILYYLLYRNMTSLQCVYLYCSDELRSLELEGPVQIWPGDR